MTTLPDWPAPEDCEPCPVCGNEERHARTGVWTCECPELDRLKAFGKQPDAQSAVRRGTR